jgi:hypothetical protein
VLELGMRSDGSKRTIMLEVGVSLLKNPVRLAPL